MFDLCVCFQQQPIESCCIKTLFFILPVVGVVWSVLAFLARNLSHKKGGRGEGKKDNSFSSSVSPGNADPAVFADLNLSISTTAKGSTNKLLWVFHSESNRQVTFVWNNNVFSPFLIFFKQYRSAYKWWKFLPIFFWCGSKLQGWKFIEIIAEEGFW